MEEELGEVELVFYAMVVKSDYKNELIISLGKLETQVPLFELFL